MKVAIFALKLIKMLLAHIFGVSLILATAMVGRAQQKLVRLPIDSSGAIEVGLGTPAQNFKLLLDTGSASTWLKESSLNARATNESRSASYRRDGRKWLAEYASGFIAQGELASDTLTLGGLQVNNQLFGVCRTTRGYSPGLFQYDGALGLGVGRRPVVDARDPIENLYRQGQLERPVFSISLEREPPGVGGTLVLGGIDEQLYTGEITYAAIESRWSFYIDRAYANIGGNEQLLSTWASVTLDSTSNVIVMPEGEFSEYRKRSTGVFEYKTHLHVFGSCEQAQSDPDLVIEIDGTKFTIPGKHLFIRIRKYESDERDTCYSAVLEGKSWILGTPFLRNFYTVYDYANKRLGFAKPSSGGNASLTPELMSDS